jgi:mRNA interferase MazF
MYQQGDIVSVPFPFTDLSQSKLRPAIIISNNSINTTGDVIIVMITSQSKLDGINILIDESQVTNPLPFNSYVRCHRIVTIENHLIVKKVSEANSQLINKVIEAIKELLKEDSSVKLED